MSIAYLLRRLVTVATTLFVVVAITFLVFRLIPGDPVQLMIGADADPALEARLRRELGTDLPAHVQFFNWTRDAIRGDFGTSIRYSRPVADLIGARLPLSVMVAGVSIVFVAVVALPLGIAFARFRRLTVVRVLATVVQLGMAIPSFWMGLMLISFLAVGMSFFPTGGFVSPEESLVGSLQSVALPALAISLPLIAIVVRYVRNSILEELSQDYVRTALSKGVPANRVLFRHVLRNSLLPVITVFGLIFADIVVGTIVVEQVFSLPGLGRLLVTAIGSRDFPLIQGLVLYIGVFVVLFNFVVDLLYRVLDPRIELS
ncbi:MAG: ABC transporter permease [Spirochaetales bacterium]